jgi:Lon protease-like protein
MMNFIPIFPLNIVVFPGEIVNLQVFEPRYIQLINECRRQKKPFGIPVKRKDALLEYGTLMEIVEIV